MPEITMKFNLPDEQNEFILATNGDKYYNALWDINNHLRSSLKYKAFDETTEEIYEKMREEIHDILDGQHVDLYEIE